MRNFTIPGKAMVLFLALLALVWAPFASADAGGSKAKQGWAIVSSEGVERGQGTPVSVDEATQAGLDARAAAGGCWQAYIWRDFAGSTGSVTYKNGRVWYNYYWCSNGSSTTSAQILSPGHSVQIYTPKGTEGPWFNNVGWEIRGALKWNFTATIAGHTVWLSQCLQTRGGATGLYSVRSNCNL